MTSLSQGRRRLSLRPARRLLVFIAVGLLWSFLSSYPNPLVFFRNLARYRRLPVDARLAERMRWQMPDKVEDLDAFVDGLLISAADWQLYRVPWYVPTAREAARAGAGDCEAKTVILASLLQGKDIPYRLHASFCHLWVDYAGRLPQAGEEEECSYLSIENGKLSLRWPLRVSWRDTLRVQKAQLWGAMPGPRKALWVCGLLWLALAMLVTGRHPPAGDLASDWRPSRASFLVRAVALSVVSMAAMALLTVVTWGAGEWGALRLKEGTSVQEALAYFAVLGGLLAWLSVLHVDTAVAVRPGGADITLRSVFGPIRRERTVKVDDIAHLALEASSGGLRPWVLWAVMTKRGRVPLLRYRDELPARAALRALGSELRLPVVVSWEGTETRTEPDQIGLSLRQRAERAPLPAAPSSAPLTGLHLTASESGWELGYPPLDSNMGRTLLGRVAAPVVIVLLSTLLLVYGGELAVSRLMWAAAAFLLAVTTYLALVLKGEIVARLAGARVEITGGELRFHSPEGTVQTLALDRIESVEPGRIGEAPTVAVVAAERVVHLCGLGSPEDREWVMAEIRSAIVQFG